MRLSEAIRLGSMLSPQNYGDLFGRRFNWRRLRFEGATCALGAAHEANNTAIKTFVVTSENKDEGAAYRGGSRKVGTIVREYQTPADWPMHQWHQCPDMQCGVEMMPTYRMIPHLNDDHKWTRVQIADWVETLEPVETPAVDTSDGLSATRVSV